MSNATAHAAFGLDQLQSSISFAIETIDSSKAKQMLATNTNNRPLNERNLTKIANAMRLNHWEFNGDPIRISEDGDLLDGQHRLSAIVQVDAALPFAVIRGLSPAVFHTIDTNQPRTAADVFAINGEDNASSLVSALRFVDLATHNYHTNRHSNIQMEIMLEEHPRIRDSVAYIKGFKATALKVPARVLYGYHYLMSAKDSTLADAFFAKLLTGENVSADEPVYVLRNTLIANATRKRSAAFSAKYIAAIVCKAWNHTRQGRRIAQLKWQGEGTKKGKVREKFPKVV
jgi:hypothetical protein